MPDEVTRSLDPDQEDLFTQLPPAPPVDTAPVVADPPKAARPPRRRRKRASANPVKSIPDGKQEPSEFVKIFETLFRSFRQQVFERFGGRCEMIILRGEKKLRFVSPEFDWHCLTEENASTILDLIEAVIVRSPYLKRSKLRRGALTLISDFYNKHYNLLEKYHAVDKVEQAFYRLKQ